MSLLSLAGESLFSYLKGQADPEGRAWLAKEIENHLLSELPRLSALISERCADLEARGCTHYEAMIIVHQVIEEQKRTLDGEKRARLTNVLVNGLAADRWDKVTHRLMLRYAIALEEEHVDRLKSYASEFVSAAEAAAIRAAEEVRLGLEHDSDDAFRHWQQRYAVEDALDLELLGLGLLKEARMSRGAVLVSNSRPGPSRLIGGDDVRIQIAALGHTFLAYLRDPSQPSNPTSHR